MLARWMGVIGGLFRRSGGTRRHAPPPAASTAPSSAPSSARPRQDRPTPFEDAVRQLRERPDGGAGRLRVVSLAEFRQSVGDKWPRLVDKVVILADTVIRAHMGAGNLSQRQGEDCWLLLFPVEHPEEARRRTVEIADDISRRLLGERCVHNTRPLAQAAHLMAGEALAANGRIDLGAMARVLTQSRAILDDDEPMAAADAGRWAALARPRMAAPMAEWQPLTRANGGGDPFAVTAPLPPGARLSLLWRPTWVAESEAIAAYSARIVRLDGSTDTALEGALAYPPDDVEAALRLDLFTAAAATHGMRQGLEGRQGPAIIVPLCWSSVISAQRNRLAAPFADLTAEDRQARIKIELFNVPDDIAPAAVADAAGFLGAIGGEVLVRLKLSSNLPHHVGGLGITRIGLDLSDLRADERMNDDRLLAVLDTLHGATAHAGIDCYLWSARRRRVVGEVVLNGFGMVNGPGLMKDVGRPTAIVPAPRRRFAVTG
jgi:hypothetical protein